MDNSADSCGQGGWTLALKVDGNKVGKNSNVNKNVKYTVMANCLNGKFSLINLKCRSLKILFKSISEIYRGKSIQVLYISLFLEKLHVKLSLLDQR